MTVRVEPDPAFAAGHARMVVPGGAAGLGGPGLRIQRDEDWGDDKLGPQGWQSTESVLVPDRAEARGADLVLHLGWAVCQYLEAGPYSVWVPGAGVEGVTVAWPDITPLHGGTVSMFAVGQAAETVVPVAALPDVVPRAGAGSGRMLAVLGLLVLLAAGGGGAWWMYGRAKPVAEAPAAPAVEAAVTPPVAPPPVIPPPVPTPATPPPVAPEPAVAPAAPPALGGLGGLGGLAVPAVLAQAPNPAAIAAEGQRRLDSDRRDDGLLLLESASDRGDPTAAAALARLYDPVLFRPGGPIPRADPRQAARYYRDAARAGADVAAARDALRQELERRSRGGDLGAGLSLKDFWP